MTTPTRNITLSRHDSKYRTRFLWFLVNLRGRYLDIRGLFQDVSIHASNLLVSGGTWVEGKHFPFLRIFLYHHLCNIVIFLYSLRMSFMYYIT